MLYSGELEHMPPSNVEDLMIYMKNTSRSGSDGVASSLIKDRITKLQQILLETTTDSTSTNNNDRCTVNLMGEYLKQKHTNTLYPKKHHVFHNIH